MVRPAALAAGLAVFALLAFLDSPLHHQPDVGSRPAWAAATAALMAIWWLTEAMPIYWTACVPLVAFPLLGVFGRGASRATSRQRRPVRRSVHLPLRRRHGDRRGHAAVGPPPPDRARHHGRRSAPTRAACSPASWSPPPSSRSGSPNTATATMMVPIGIALIAQIEAQHRAARLCALRHGDDAGDRLRLERRRHRHQDRHRAERASSPASSSGSASTISLPPVPGASACRSSLLFLPVVWCDALAARPRATGSRRRSAHGDRARARASSGRSRGRRRSSPASSSPPRAALDRRASRSPTALAPRWRHELADVPTARRTSKAASPMLAALVLLLWPRGGAGARARGRSTTVPWETLLLLGGGFAMAAGDPGERPLGLARARSSSGSRELPPLRPGAAREPRRRSALSAVASNTATIAVMLVVLKDAVGARGADHRPLRRDHRLLLRLRAAGRHAAQRHRLRQRLRDDPAHGADRRRPRPRSPRCSCALWCWVVVPRVL